MTDPTPPSLLVKNFQQVMSAILEERLYQDAKWGTIVEHPHTAAEWLLIIEGELVEAKQAWQKGTSDQLALSEVLQIAAVAVACLEQHGLGVPRFNSPEEKARVMEHLKHWSVRQ